MPTEVEKHLIEAEKEIKKLLDKREKNDFQRTKHHRKALIDFLSGKPVSIRTEALKEESEAYSKSSELNWNYVQGEKLALHDKQPQDVFVDTWLKESICRLNKTIAKQPDLADEVIHRMRGVLLEANYSGLVRANEIFYDWLSGRTPMPLGKTVSI